MNTRNRALIVEDDKAISQFLASSLTGLGLDTAIAHTIEQALQSFKAKKPQLMILDLELPDGDGKDLLRQVREYSDIPIIVLSARQSEQEKVACFNLGADDYLAKPFGIQELLARVQVALRHATMMTLRDHVYSLEGLVVDLASNLVTLHGEPLHLTPLEFKLLTTLARMPGKIITHRQLLMTVWGEEYGDETHYLRIHMGRLRAKIEENPASPRFILTEAGIGYRLAAN
ncbi:MAG: two-component system response regulator KdpE [Betaproteobacteria bacterium HGW-Betaproteobacteria-1]|jgi:two-component system KDP operon response regulator KdpE|nr:MAG: two-component system response regulator KdpE [Betaproteobacteria bacterium HGW-Betaproteobacteria-1]